jgi:hypothetical protein
MVVAQNAEAMRMIAASYLSLAKKTADIVERNRLVAYAILYQDLAHQIEELPKLPAIREAR